MKGEIMEDNKLCGEFSAKVWAEEFVRSVKIKPEIATDEGTMLGWFANAIMAGYDKANQEKAGSIEVGVEEIKDTIVNNKITPELVEKHFPKGQCNERGNAIVLHAEMLIELARVTADYLKEKE